MSERDERAAAKALLEELSGMLGALAAIAREHRARTDEGIPALESDLLGDLDDEDADEAPFQLAADDRPAATWPATYRGPDGLCLVLGFDGAGAYLAHEGGPAVEALGVRLAAGEERPVDLDAPPEAIDARLPDGSILRLPRA